MDTITTAMVLAAEKTGDVGRRVGFDMSEGWGMLLAAWVAALAAVFSAVVTYRAARRQVRDQAEADHRAWRRQNRFEAYQRFINMCEGAQEALEKRRTAPGDGDGGVLRALEQMLSAETAIRLAGPASMADQAREVTKAVHDARTYVLRPKVMPLSLPTREWLELVRGIVAAEQRFVEAAAKVLDDPKL